MHWSFLRAEKAVKQESDDNIKNRWRAKSSLPGLGKETGWNGNLRKNQVHINDNIVEISLKNESWRPEVIGCHADTIKRPRNNTCVKNLQEYWFPLLWHINLHESFNAKNISPKVYVIEQRKFKLKVQHVSHYIMVDFHAILRRLDELKIKHTMKTMHSTPFYTVPTGWLDWVKSKNIFIEKSKVLISKWYFIVIL